MDSLVDLPLYDAERRHRVIVETPRGCSFKVHYDPGCGAFALQRPLPFGHAYPYDWGFFPSTKAEDGDPLDAMIVSEISTWPGVVVPCTPLAVLRVVQTSGGERRSKKRVRNDRVIVVPAVDARVGYALARGTRLRRELEEFFLLVGERAAGGKRVTVEGWGGARAARECVSRAARAYADDATR